MFLCLVACGVFLPSQSTLAAGVDTLMPHFVAFMSERFPELSNIDRLREVSDLSSPAQWYVVVHI